MTDTIDVAEVYGEAYRAMKMHATPRNAYIALGRCVEYLVESGYRLILDADEPEEDGMTIYSLILVDEDDRGVMDQIDFPTIHHAVASAVVAAAKEL